VYVFDQFSSSKLYTGGPGPRNWCGKVMDVQELQEGKQVVKNAPEV
jgi:hypothetical protein